MRGRGKSAVAAVLLFSLLALSHSSSTPTTAALAGGDLTAIDAAAAPACWEAVINVTVPGRAVKRLDARYLGSSSSSSAATVATARLVHVGGGCKPVAPANFPHPWVALAPLKGDCSPAERVRVFGRAGAAAVLLYGNAEEVASAASSEQHGSNASAMVTESGDDLLRMLNNSSMVTLSVSPLTACARNYGSTVNRTSVLFVSISFVVLMIISLAWLVFYYVQRFRYIHAKDRLSRRLCSAAKKALSKIPTKNIKSEDKEIQGDGECCAVCIEPYKVSDVLRILPCRHEFHKSCIDPWLLEHRTCPMCKMDILKHYGFVFTGSQESILHMEIEEVVGLGTASRDTESLTASPQIRPSGQVHSAPSSPDLGSHNSGASTPNELSPALGSGPRFASSRGGGGVPSGRINSTAASVRDQVCSNCGSELLNMVPEDNGRGVCVVELGRPELTEQEDCDSEGGAAK